MTNNTIIHGAITHKGENPREDYLFRVSLKAVIFNEDGHVLVVKETGRDWWDLPGGGIDHGESIKQALTRELHEEVSMTGDFDYRAILAADPHFLKANNLFQIRITFLVTPNDLTFSPGEEADEVMFVDPATYASSDLFNERMIFEYSQLAK